MAVSTPQYQEPVDTGCSSDTTLPSGDLGVTIPVSVDGPIGELGAFKGL